MNTAVQWLDEQIKEKMGLDEHDTNQLKWFIDKAFEKEKEQIIQAVNKNEQKAVDFCNEAVLKYWKHEGLFGIDKDAGTTYFNETYNK